MEKPQYIYECGPLMVNISHSVEANHEIWAKVKPGDTISEGPITFKILAIDLEARPQMMRMEWDGLCSQTPTV